MIPTDAISLPTLENGVAPSFSNVRRIKAVDRPEPDLNAMHLLAKAAPASKLDSEEDPAVGKVRVRVDVLDASSVTTVSPDGNTVLEAVEALRVDGVVAGTLVKKERENDDFRMRLQTKI